jgi:hypothetical protein
VKFNVGARKTSRLTETRGEEERENTKDHPGSLKDNVQLTARSKEKCHTAIFTRYFAIDYVKDRSPYY